MTKIIQLPDYMQDDAEVTAMLQSVNYDEYLRLMREYPHPDDQAALTAAWTVVASATIRARKPAAMRCRDCGAYGHTNSRGLGISCGCAAE